METGTLKDLERYADILEVSAKLYKEIDNHMKQIVPAVESIRKNIKNLEKKSTEITTKMMNRRKKRLNSA
jgi:hypothetical protein